MKERTLLTRMAVIAFMAMQTITLGTLMAYAQVSPPVAPALNEKKDVDEPDKQEYEIITKDPTRQKTISLFMGFEHTESLPFLPEGAKFKGTYKKVTKISVDRGSQVLKFNAIKPGFATFSIYDAQDKKIYDFELTVEKSDNAKIAAEIKALLSDIEGITVKSINNKVVVDGQVLLARDMNRILSVISEYKDRASSLVTLSPNAQRKIALAIANDINNQEITVRSVNDKFILEGVANDQAEKDKAEAIAQMYVPDLVKETGEEMGKIIKLRKTFVLNLITVKAAPPKDPGKIIQLVVHFVELNKNFQKSFKFQFTPTLEDNSNISFTNDSAKPGSWIFAS
ncbi:MAG: BON domain-containing protein, partial [Bdellovibrionota bacterium]